MLSDSMSGFPQGTRQARGSPETPDSQTICCFSSTCNIYQRPKETWALILGPLSASVPSHNQLNSNLRTSIPHELSNSGVVLYAKCISRLESQRQQQWQGGDSVLRQAERKEAQGEGSFWNILVMLLMHLCTDSRGTNNPGCC